jgi:hypothetical protein
VIRVGFDCESHRIRPGVPVPKGVCLSYKWEDGTEGVIPFWTGAAVAWFKAQAARADVILVGANTYYDLSMVASYDASLITTIFDLFEADRIRDVEIGAKMRDIRDGLLKFSYDDAGEAIKTKHSLADLVARFKGTYRFHEKKGALTAEEFLARWPRCHFGDGALPYDEWPDEAKVEPWRVRFSMLDGVPIALWPPPAYEYALADSVDALDVDTLLGPPIVDECNQLRYQWALELMHVWGVRTDPEAIAKVKSVLVTEAKAGTDHLLAAGLMEMARKRNKHTKIMEVLPKRRMAVIKGLVAARYKAMGKEHPLTDGGDVSTARETLEESGDPDLLVLAETGATLKLLSKDIPQLESGARHPLIIRWNGLVETGRTSASPNIQNNPRKGGIRECYVPRAGWVYVFVDFDTAELRALAQACRNLLGYSTLGDLLNAGQDPHLALGATLMGITYDEIVKRKEAGDQDAIDYRQFAKIPNFGLPGGMGPDSLVAWAMSQLGDKPELKARMTREFALELINGWHRTFPEMREYFDWISAATGPIGEATITQLYSGRVRGGVPYCAACNTLFQGLVADAAKSALYTVQRAAWREPGSPLYRITRPNLFIHDEIGAEVWYGDPAAAAAAAETMAKLMVDEAQTWMPDQIIKAKPVMVRRWYKGAEPVYVDGRLVPCRPDKVNGKTRWVPDL